MTRNILDQGGRDSFGKLTRSLEALENSAMSKFAAQIAASPISTLANQIAALPSFMKTASTLLADDAISQLADSEMSLRLMRDYVESQGFDTVAEYLQQVPPTEAELTEAATGITASEIMKPGFIAQDTLDAPALHRADILRHVVRYLLCLLLTIYLGGKASGATTANGWSLTTVAVLCSDLLLGGRFWRIARDLPAIQRGWKNRRRAAPVARVTAYAGELVSVHEFADEHSQVIGWLRHDELVALGTLGKRRWKTVVLEFDEQYKPKVTGWVKRRHLERVSLKDSYAIIRAFTPGDRNTPYQ